MVDERLWEGDLNEPKSISGEREIPFDRRGILKEVITRVWMKSKHRKPKDFIFATRNGTPLQRRNVLRHVKIAAKALGLPKLRQRDERSWYRVVYLSHIEDVIHVLHCFEKKSAKTPRSDVLLAQARLKMVRQRILEQKKKDNRQWSGHDKTE